MKNRYRSRFGILMALLVMAAFALTGCSGSTGPAGPAGTTGPAGATGPAGPAGSVVVDAAALTPAQADTFTMQGTVTGVTIASPPVVNFFMTDAQGNGIVGLAAKTGANLNNMRFALAKLVPGTNGSPDQWVSYIVTDTTRPTTENTGTLVDKGDGTYTYTFVKNITDPTQTGGVVYEPNLTHRLAIQCSGTLPGSGETIYSPANIIYDFIPATGQKVTAADTQREIVSITACNECHGKLAMHGGGRIETKFCVVCHTDQRRTGRTEATTDASGNFPAITYDATGRPNSTPGTYIVDDRAVGNFPNMIHKIHMGNKLTKQNYNFARVLFNEIGFPQDQTNCRKCHKGDTPEQLAVTPQGNNWKTKPSRLACGACHDNVNFATGSNHIGGPQTSDFFCALCHDAVSIATTYHTLPATADIAKRTLSAAITGVVVDANGGVTVTFTLTDNGVPVTDRAKFSNPEFSLAKLVPGIGGASSDWVSYTSRFRTKDAAVAPVLQGYNENNGTVTDLGGGTWSYKFKLITAEPEGDIRNVTHAHNVSTVAGAYNSANWPTGPNVVTYEPTLTHRVAMIVQKVGTPNIDNATNAYFDFVPDGGAVTQTRNIVTMNNCATCHAGIKRHKGYAIELCGACHNQGTFDPYSGETVDLQRFVHKLHMGKDLPSVIAGGTFMINGINYGKLAYPGIIKNCSVCHVEGAGAPKNAANWRTTPTSRACGTCHDSTIALAHISSNITGGTELCSLCHGTGKIADVVVMHNK